MICRKYIGILCIIFTSLFCNNTKANDSIKITNPIPIKSIGLNTENNYFLVTNKDISVPFPARHINIFSWILLDKMPDGFYNQFYPWDLKFSKCSFSVYETPFDKIKNLSVSKYLLFDSCLLNYLTITNLKKNATIINSAIKVLVIDSAENSKLSFSSNPLLNILRIQNCKNIKLNFQNNYHQDSSSIFVGGSTIQDILFVPNYATKSVYEFVNDTIVNNVNTPLAFSDDIKHSKNEQIFNFRNCYINADFWNFGSFYNSILTFENCTFGPNAYLGSLGINKLTFRNCRNVLSQLSLGFSNDSTEILLSFINTDVSKFKFDFPENVTLFFDTLYKKDVAYNTFESLLSKYRSEGKHDSYQNVDIQYKRFTRSKFVNWIDKIWWHYGYKKYYVFYWLLVPLTIFSFVNFRVWDRLNTAYPIFNDEKNSYYNSVNFKFRNLLKKISKVILFSLLVFFSLYMNFGKMSFKNVSILYWIFFQYIVGLTFLFLILNFVIKSS